MTRVNGTLKVKICCSDFKETTNVNVTYENEDEVDISRHNSVKLLPYICGAFLEERILGGEVAGLGDFPWLALIAHEYKQYNGQMIERFDCGGTIINPKYILTAAHCVDNKKNAWVRVGEYNIDRNLDCQIRFPKTICESHTQDVQVERKIVHEDYHLTPITENDIALLRLTEEIDFSFENVAPICLPIHKGNIHNKMGLVVGWGTTEFGPSSSVPLKEYVPVLTDDRCNENHKGNIICAGGNGRNFCKDDSGGPLMFRDEYNGRYSMIQYGILSGGCQLRSDPGIYTDVRKYMSWILDNIVE